MQTYEKKRNTPTIRLFFRTFASPYQALFPYFSGKIINSEPRYNISMQYKNTHTPFISSELQLAPLDVDNTLSLLKEGCTIPFIARYRKEKTHGLNEVQIESIALLTEKLTELDKRKTTILKSIEEQGKLTPELAAKIEACHDTILLEDLYLPYKPKRKTRALLAKERGLEPLAQLILQQRDNNLQQTAKKFLNEQITNVDQALQGACDIIAERMAEDEVTRERLRNAFRRSALISAKVVKGKEKEDIAQKYRDYFDFEEPLKRCSGNRLLAMRRGESEGVLRVKISIEPEAVIENMKRRFIKSRGNAAELLASTVEDALKRLLLPAMETEFSTLSREKAEAEAIEVFTNNLRQLLLAAPLGQKTVLAVDPGIRTGCKVVVLDTLGNLLHHTVIYLFPPQGNEEKAMAQITALVAKYSVEAISVGNGTASREATTLLQKAAGNIPVHVVSEDGASVYSASKVAREEFPELDVTVRGAISIGRRLMDPLAELVKIDPKSIGVGQYQHDVDQKNLKRSLDFTVERCVNNVGVNVNTAGVHLLTYISGLGPVLAQNIVDYRNANGPFRSRFALKKVPRMGEHTYRQCAGFLRIANAPNPLDNSAVHPDAYPIVEQMAKDHNCRIETLIGNKSLIDSIDLTHYVTTEVGMPTLQDIVKELEKPGRDPRGEVETFEFDARIHTINDLQKGMRLPGIVTNITKFGVFVDIGVHQDGLVHISQMANHFVSNPNEVVHLQQHVWVTVTDVDLPRKRISLSMREG